MKSPLVWGAWIETRQEVNMTFSTQSPLVWGAWIETRLLRWGEGRLSRPSYGGRGLKLEPLYAQSALAKSPLVWGAWIETRPRQAIACRRCRPSYGGRGLKPKIG